MQIKIGEDMETKDEMYYGHAILRLREIEHFIYNIMREKMNLQTISKFN